jgi:hypothetical protein
MLDIHKKQRVPNYVSSKLAALKVA